MLPKPSRSTLWLVGAAALLPLSSCFCLDIASFFPKLPDAGPVFPTEIPQNAIEIGEGDIERYVACGQSEGASEAGIDAANALFAPNAAGVFDDGTLEAELSDDGCARYERVTSGGRTVSARFYTFTGEVGFAQLPGEQELRHIAYFHVEAIWQRDGNGVMTGQIHDDTPVPSSLEEEPPFEWQIVSDPSTGTRQTTRFAPNGDVLLRITVETVDGDTTQTIEKLVGGALVSETTAIDDDNRGQGVNCNDPGVTCDDDTANVLDDAMDQALKKAHDCMKRLDNARDDTWMRYVLQQQRWSELHTWGCLPGPCSFGRWCDTCQDEGGATSTSRPGRRSSTTIATPACRRCFTNSRTACSATTRTSSSTARCSTRRTGATS